MAIVDVLPAFWKYFMETGTGRNVKMLYKCQYIYEQVYGRCLSTQTVIFNHKKTTINCVQVCMKCKNDYL